MLRRIVIITVAIVVLVSVWLVWNHFHYSAPDMPAEKIEELALEQLNEDVPSLLKRNNPHFQKDIIGLNIIDIKQIEGKTYLVFKLDYDMTMPPYEKYQYTDYLGGSYFLGYRLVEKKWGGISLRDGMEFESNYMSVGPVDCGYHPQEGIFYGFCKDPKVSKVILESSGEPVAELTAKNRLILGIVPGNKQNVNPRFFTDNDDELESAYGLQVAMVSEDRNELEKYIHSSLNWFSVGSGQITYLTPEIVDTVWVFPDMHQKVLEKETINYISNLVSKGISVIFVGMKNPAQVNAAMGIEQENNSDQEVAEVDIEGIYITAGEGGKLVSGLITLGDNQISPLIKTSLELKYQLVIPQKEPKNEGKEPDSVESSTKLNMLNSEKVEMKLREGGF